MDIGEPYFKGGYEKGRKEIYRNGENTGEG